MAAAPRYLVSFNNVSASAGGIDISSILELQVTASANTVPYVTLIVDAGHPGGGKAEATDAMTLGGVTSLYQTFRGMVRQATLSLSLTADVSGAEGSGSESLSLNGWLLTDVGVSPLREGEGAALMLTFMHPLIMADFGGSIPGLIARDPQPDELGGEDPLSVFVESLNAYAEAARDDQRSSSGVGTDAAAVRDVLIQHLERATSSLEASVTWSGGSLPALSSGLGDVYIRYGLSTYASPAGGGSVLRRLLGALIPECSLALGGDFTGPSLQLRPFTPWEQPTRSISDSDILGIQFPQHDPTPLSGIHFVANDSSDRIQYSYQRDASQVGKLPSDIFYVPDAELNAAYLYGPVYQMHEPGWLSQARDVKFNTLYSYISDATRAASGGLQTPTNVDFDNPVPQPSPLGGDLPFDEYSSAMLACAKAYYETMLMCNFEFSVRCRLVLSSGICPGEVVSIAPGGLSGYVTSVTHTISVAHGSAVTTITCSHPRVGGPPNGLGGTNSLYT